MKKDLLIEVMAGPGKGRVFRVSGRRFIIGRGPREEVDVNLEPDRFVSRRHAIGHVEEEVIVVEEWPDAPSKAGLITEGMRRKSVRLRAGERLWVGATELVFRFADRPVLSWGEAIRRWCRRLLIFFPLVGVGVGAAAFWPDREESGNDFGSRAFLEQVREARNRGEFALALKLLEHWMGKGTDRNVVEEAERWKGECRRLQARMETLRVLEESLQIEECRDGWLRFALELPTDDPLRGWIEAEPVARLNARLKALGR